MDEQNKLHLLLSLSLLIILLPSVAAAPTANVTTRFNPFTGVLDYILDASTIGNLSTGANDTMWNLSGSNLYPADLTYNVGIGNNTPTHPLTVQDGARFQGSSGLWTTSNFKKTLEFSKDSGILWNGDGISNTFGLVQGGNDLTLSFAADDTASSTRTTIWNARSALGRFDVDQLLYLTANSYAIKASADTYHLVGRSTSGNQFGTLRYDNANDYVALGMNFDDSLTVHVDKQVGINDITPDAELDIAITDSTDVGLIVQGAASQSANLHEWQNSAGTVLSKVDSGGSFDTNVTYKYDGVQAYKDVTEGMFVGQAGGQIGASAGSGASGNLLFGTQNVGGEVGRYATAGVTANIVIGTANAAYRMGQYKYQVTNNLIVGPGAGYQAAQAAGNPGGDFRFNQFAGYYAGYQYARSTNAAVENNIAFGTAALRDADIVQTTQPSVANTAVGTNAGYQAQGLTSSGSLVANTLIGYNSGYRLGYNASGQAQYNTIIGPQAGQDFGYSAPGHVRYNTLIGYLAGQGWTDGGNNLLVMSNSNRRDTLVFGDFANEYLNVNYNLGVGLNQTAPTATITVMNDGGKNLQEWQNSSGDILSSVDEQGWLSIGSTDPSSPLYVTSTLNSGGVEATFQGFHMENNVLSGTNVTDYRNVFGYVTVGGAGDTDSVIDDLDNIYGGYVNWATINNYYGFGRSATANVGTINNWYGGYIQEPTDVGAGDTQNIVMLYLEYADTGSASNYQIYSAGGESELHAGLATKVPLSIVGASSQSANLQEWQNSAGTALAYVTASGDMVVADQLISKTALYLDSTGTTDVLVRPNGVTRMTIKGDDGSGRVGVGTIPAGSGQLHVTSLSAARSGLTVQAAASQTANLTEWQNSTGGVLASVNATGGLQLDTTGSCITMPGGGTLCGNTTCITMYSPDGGTKVEACN